MSRSSTQRKERPRELRRRVMLPARMRTSSGWSDACILNVSSRGLMIHANYSAFEDRRVELRHGDHAIRAQVVWREGARAGLCAEERIPVEEILSLGGSACLQVAAGRLAGVERRRRPRSHDDSRLAARAFEFASVAVIAAALAVSSAFWVGEALAVPLTQIRAALGLG